MSLPTNVTTARSVALHVSDHNTLHGLYNAIEAVGNGQAIVRDDAGAIVGGTILTEENLATMLDGFAGTAAVYSTTITGDGSETTWTITHGLNSGDIDVRLRSAASGTSFTEGQDFVLQDAVASLTGVNTVSLEVSPAIPDTHVWRVTVIAWDKLEVLLGDTGGTALTAADTSTVNLTVTAGELTADVIPAAIDHGALGGIDADDHTQYALADGTRGAFAASAHTTDVDAHQLAASAVSISSGVVTLNLNSAKIFTVALTENVTGITVSNFTSNKSDGCRVIFTFSTTARTMVWPAWYWPGGFAPTPPAATGERLVVDLESYDGGATVYASYAPMSLAP